MVRDVWPCCECSYALPRNAPCGLAHTPWQSTHAPRSCLSTHAPAPAPAPPSHAPAPAPPAS
eukprot:10841584-Alexandrium_andersonii.AAC.1